MVDVGQDGLRALGFAVALLIIVAFGWYVVSGQTSRRRGAALARLAAELVRPLGTIGSVSWLRGGGCSYELQSVDRPFTRIQVVARPAPRTVIPFLSDPSRDRRDLVAIAIDAVRPPRLNFELVELETPVGARALMRAVSHGWNASDYQFYGQTLRLLAPDIPLAEEILRRAPKYPTGSALSPVRFAVSSTAPHLSLTLAHPEALVGTGPRLSSWLNRLTDWIVKSGNGKMV